MSRKSFLAFAFGFLALAAAPAFSQQADPVVTPTVQDAIATIRTEVQAERQAIVAENLKLTEAEGQAFWPVYREYRQAAQKLGDRVAKLVVDYAANYDTMTDEQARGMLREFLQIQKEEAALKIEWSKKLEKLLPPKKLARFFQIENKLDLLVNLDLASGIPLVK
jgi:Spy/CpxP family protein refolding chaperone